jgi:hypothetical protein
MPPTSNNGLGILFVNGLIRSPRPAASIIAFILFLFFQFFILINPETNSFPEGVMRGVSFLHFLFLVHFL